MGPEFFRALPGAVDSPFAGGVLQGQGLPFLADRAFFAVLLQSVEGGGRDGFPKPVAHTELMVGDRVLEPPFVLQVRQVCQTVHLPEPFVGGPGFQGHERRKTRFSVIDRLSVPFPDFPFLLRYGLPEILALEGKRSIPEILRVLQRLRLFPGQGRPVGIDGVLMLPFPNAQPGRIACSAFVPAGIFDQPIFHDVRQLVPPFKHFLLGFFRQLFDGDGVAVSGSSPRHDGGKAVRKHGRERARVAIAAGEKILDFHGQTVVDERVAPKVRVDHRVGAVAIHHRDHGVPGQVGEDEACDPQVPPRARFPYEGLHRTDGKLEEPGLQVVGNVLLGQKGQGGGHAKMVPDGDVRHPAVGGHLLPQKVPLLGGFPGGYEFFAELAP